MKRKQNEKKMKMKRKQNDKETKEKKIKWKETETVKNKYEEKNVIQYYLKYSHDRYLFS